MRGQTLACLLAHLVHGAHAPGPRPWDPAYRINCSHPMSHSQCLTAPGCKTHNDRCRPPMTEDGDHDNWCCCDQSDGGEKYCRTNPFLQEGTQCERACCDNSWVPCAYGCCPNDMQCGFNMSTDTPLNEHIGNLQNLECCTKSKDFDINTQNQQHCCAWGVGTDCRERYKKPCCLVCPRKFQQESSGMVWCDSKEFDRTHWCQDDCTLWEQPSPTWLKNLIVAVSVVSTVLVIGATIILCCSRRCQLRWCRRCRRIQVPEDVECSREQAGPLTDPLTMYATESEMPPKDEAIPGIGAQDEQSCDFASWFLLLIGIARYEEHSPHRPRWFSRPFSQQGESPSYVDLDRVPSDLKRLKEKLLDVQPNLREENIVMVENATAEAMRTGRDTLVHKIAGTQDARVIVFFAGHGHENHFVGSDGRLVPIDEFFNNIRSGRGKQPFEKSRQAQIIGIFDCCRDQVPHGAQGAARKPFVPSFPRLTDGSLYTIYATDQLKSASDGGLTDALLQALEEPGLNVVELFEHMTKSRITGLRGQRPHFNIDGEQATSIIIHQTRRRMSSGSDYSTSTALTRRSDSVSSACAANT